MSEQEPGVYLGPPPAVPTPMNPSDDAEPVTMPSGQGF
jgi:hypothetical protein